MDYYTAVRAFIIAADTLSLSKAALQLEVKTSTISRYISQLEADMGIALFNRSTRGLVLTEGGRVFLEHATTALKALDDARRITSSLNVRPRGLLRVTVPPAFGRQHIVRHLPTFLERYQDIELDIEFQNETVNLIDNGIDLAIRLGVLPESQLKTRKLAPHYRIACASPDYLRLAGTPERPSDLNEHKILRLSLGADTNWHFVKRGAQAGSDTSERVMTFQGRLRVDDVDSLRELAIAGVGIAFLPYWALGRSLESKELIQVLPEWDVHGAKGESAIWAVYPPKKNVSSKVRAFVDFYADLFCTDDYWAKLRDGAKS
ncbi:MAG: LysR family transcriptional regulator [Herbaspirillum sp.]|nr:LysR family transcriptional regulator [Herbaspirillum sp.]